MAPRRKPQESKGRLSKFVQEFGEFLSLFHISPVDFSIFHGFEICGTLTAGWDVLLGSIAAFYVFMVPYTKVEESFNVQVFNFSSLTRYVCCTGALLVSILASPVVLMLHLLHVPKVYSLYAVRLVLGCITLWSLRSLRIEIRRKFGYHVEAFFAILTSAQFHLLFYSTRPLPNIFAFCLVTLAYSFWFRGDALTTLKCLTIATAVFRCDTVLLFGPIGIALLLSKSVSLWNAVKCCISTAFLCIGLTMLVDTIMWGRVLWPELELAALLDRRIWQYIVPVFSFVLLYSKLPHKELRFIIGAIPIFNVSAAITASRIYKNRKKTLWRWLYIMMLVSILVSLGCSIMTFMASYENYPGGYALKTLHRTVGSVNTTRDKWVHIDPFAAMNGVSRFLENNSPWRYSKEEGITLAEYHTRNFAYLLSEHSKIDGFQCLFSVDGFSKVHLRIGFPPIVMQKEPKVYVHGNIRHEDVAHSNWSGCP
ncbi:hypothetical protein J5N97_029651 [Dioscorea zingiberensis]|uniref:Mannosyltransferase n=1 Tax=Dioscorea zingiberensis TaxID=325984 RepID=A0A9D5BWB9_9LILI|nr:hypothetical protein J5N97_029651 [Dioscorea zingiberensis]